MANEDKTDSLSPEVRAGTSVEQPTAPESKYLYVVSVLVVAALLLGGFLYFENLKTSGQKGLVLQPKTDTVPTSTDVLQKSDVGTGWSTNDDSIVAVVEAISTAKAKLKSEPHFAYVAFSVGYEYEKVIDEVRKQLGPSVKIHGVTSGNGVFTQEGLHIGPVGSIGVLLVADKGIDFGVGSADLTEAVDINASRQTGREAITKAIKDAGRDVTDPPNMIIYAGTPRRGDDMYVLDGIADVVGKLVPVIGGNAGDETITGKYKIFEHLKGSDWYEFTKDKTYHNGIVLTAIYTDKKIGWSFDSGAKITDKGGIVTKSEGNIIHEIDGKPALEVYDEWLGQGNTLYDLLKADDFKEIIRYTALSPLSIVIKNNEGQVGYYTLHPIPTAKDLATKTLTIAVPVEQGVEVRFFSGTWQTILNRAESLPAEALLRGDMNPSDALFGIMTFCEGSAVSLPASELPKVSIMTNNALGDIPYIGIMTEGEHGPIVNIRNVNANLVESMVVFGK